MAMVRDVRERACSCEYKSTSYFCAFCAFLRPKLLLSFFVRPLSLLRLFAATPLFSLHPQLLRHPQMRVVALLRERHLTVPFGEAALLFLRARLVTLRTAHACDVVRRGFVGFAHRHAARAA